MKPTLEHNQSQQFLEGKAAEFFADNVDDILIRHSGDLAMSGAVDHNSDEVHTPTGEVISDLDREQAIQQAAQDHLDSAAKNIAAGSQAISSQAEAAPDTRLSLAGAHEVLSDEEIAMRFERDGAVKDPPRFAEQVSDDSRQTPFYYVPPFRVSTKANLGEGTGRKSRVSFLRPLEIAGELSEIAGLRQVQEMLTSFIGDNPEVFGKTGKQQKTAAVVRRAEDMLENLTFVGQPEFEEAVTGLGVLWKTYLDADPDRKLCVLADVDQLMRFGDKDKSDQFIRDRVIATWTDEEREKYGGRLVADVNDLSDTDMEHSKIVLVDDWALSGKQMRDNYHNLLRNTVFRRYAWADKVEINALVASEDRLKNGLMLHPTDPDSDYVPVKAYYRSHTAKTSWKAHYSYVTGLHCYVNTGFGDVCKAVVRRGVNLGQRSAKSADLTRIYPRYKFEPPRYEITGDRIVELRSDEDNEKAARVVRRIMGSNIIREQA